MIYIPINNKEDYEDFIGKKSKFSDDGFDTILYMLSHDKFNLKEMGTLEEHFKEYTNIDDLVESNNIDLDWINEHLFSNELDLNNPDDRREAIEEGLAYEDIMYVEGEKCVIATKLNI